MGRQIPTECEHGVTVDGGDFAKSDYCEECDKANKWVGSEPEPASSGNSDVVSAQPTELERWELFRAEMLEHQKQLGKLAKSYLELEAFDSAAECAIKADGIKYVIGRMPKPAH